MVTLTDEELLLREQAAAEFADDPEYYFSHALQVPTLQLAPSSLVVNGLWSGERDILRLLPRALIEHKEIYIGSGHSLGKDFITGGIPLWFQETRYPAKTILTGPTARQVHEITWNELERHVGRRNPVLPPLGGRPIQGKWEWDPEHFILAFTVADSQQHIGKAQGFHSENLCIIVTEAQAVPDKVKEQLDGLMASGHVLFIAIGNPLVTTGWFAKGLRNKTDNLVIHLDCEQSPNVLERKAIIPGLCSYEWVEKARKAWFAEDPNHPLWLAKVKGQLPTKSVSSVFDRDLVERSYRYPLRDAGLRVSVGVDVAEFGDDESVFYTVGDGLTREVVTTAKHEPTDTAGRASMIRVRQRASVIVVDRIGVGAGVASMLREMQDERAQWTVVSFAGSEKPTTAEDPEGSPYLNQRAEAYFYAREQVQLGKVMAPKDAQTVDELCETQYVVTSKGKIMLEDKADIKERLGRSPDRADAWVLAVWGLKYATTIPSPFYDATDLDTDAAAAEVPLNSGYGFRS